MGISGGIPWNCAGWASFVKPGERVAAWFSCGAASAVGIKRLLDRVSEGVIVDIYNTPVAQEHSDNRRFLRDCEDWYGVKINIVASEAYPDGSIIEVFDDKKCMSFANGYAPCTDEIKKKARQELESRERFDWIFLGFTYEEKKRFTRFQLTERENILPVLTAAKMTKADCWQTLYMANIAPPEMYRLGFNNANCIGCVKATSPTYWNRVRQVFPHHFESRAVQSRLLGVKLARVKGDRVFLDELDPLALGAPIESLEGECGLFCEERQLDIFGELA